MNIFFYFPFSTPSPSLNIYNYITWVYISLFTQIYSGIKALFAPKYFPQIVILLYCMYHAYVKRAHSHFLLFCLNWHRRKVCITVGRILTSIIIMSKQIMTKTLTESLAVKVKSESDQLGLKCMEHLLCVSQDSKSSSEVTQTNTS